MMKTIVIEGTDGSGKETQSKLLVSNLEKKGFKVKYVSFPNYNNDSSILIKRYLNGDYGEDPNSINPYSAALLYSVDRLNFFLTNNLDDYDVLVCDRYVESNLIHQASKIENTDERDEFSNWLTDLEYKKLNFPKPNKVFFLEVEPEITQNLISKRNKDSNNLDIHEKSTEYLKDCFLKAKDIASKKWLGYY